MSTPGTPVTQPGIAYRAQLSDQPTHQANGRAAEDAHARADRLTAAPPGAEVLPPENGYVFIETKSGKTRCQLNEEEVGCEAQFTNSAGMNGMHANGVRVTADGEVSWLVGNLGDIPAVTLDYRTYHAVGWTIDAQRGRHPLHQRPHRPRHGCRHRRGAGVLRSSMTAAQRERAALVETMRTVGPDAPTLCGDWTTRDLAAHLVVREGRLDTTPGITIPLSPATRPTSGVRSPVHRLGRPAG